MTVHRPPVPCLCGPVPNPCMPNPITITCIRCSRPFVTDAASPAARDQICLSCYFGPELDVDQADAGGVRESGGRTNGVVIRRLRSLLLRSGRMIRPSPMRTSAS